MRRRSVITQVLFTVLASGSLSGNARAACGPVVARLVVIQGGVESQRARQTEWRAAANAEHLCAGDRLRTLERSRATLQLNDETYVSLDQRTTVVLSGLQPKMPSWLDLIKGVIYLRSRTPSSLDIKTSFINAVIKGTEFLVVSNDDEGQVTVFEGRVEASNALGTVLLSDGQTAVAQVGKAPVRKLLVTPEDAVQWALYYPPLIDLESLRRSSADPAVKRAADRYLAGDSLGALRELEAGDQPYALLRAALLLGLGRVDEAEPLLGLIPKTDAGQALALRSVIALARNDKTQALQLAERATAAQPRSAVPWTALSYARQAHFNLEAALESARKASELAPDNGLAQTRLAELLDSLGRRNEARAAAQRAVRLNPGLGRAWTLLGFTHLAAMDRDAAKASFDNALRRDAADPLAHFGLGLARIRAGDVEEGTADLEIAASLDPNDALTRSYLGKAYYEQKRNKIAETEYGRAKLLDPKDPTPWFYDAIKKQTENRPVEALQDIEKSIALNDNRLVYRSRQLLDDDLAARSASLGRIYQDLGFEQRAQVEGWNSLASNPQNYSGHRLLSDTYRKVPRQEVARVSELLQSQLLQPLNVTPVPPTLAESNLLVLDTSGPARFSFNEFNPAFSRNRFALQTFGLAGSLDTLSDEVVQSGLQDNFSYSAGQYHYQTNGYRPNNDLRQDIYNAFAQARLAPSLSIQGELRYKESEFGDIGQRFDLSSLDISERNHNRTASARGGLHWEMGEGKDLLASFVHSNVSRANLSFGDIGDATEVADSGELQYLQKGSFWSVIAGGGYFSSNRHNFFFSPNPDFPIDQRFQKNITHGNLYAYNQFHWGKDLTLTAGLSADDYDEEGFTRRKINPKLGLLWQATPATTLRAAWFTTVKRPFTIDQTIEPTQIAGFNQFFDDINGAKTERYGVGIDHAFLPGLYAGAETSWRRISYPSHNPNDEVILRLVEEWYQRAYLNWTPTEDLAISLEYFYENLQREHGDFAADKPRRAVTYTVPLTLSYYHPSGLFARSVLTLVDQDIQAAWNGSNNPLFTRSDIFGLWDASVGFRLPKRYGILSFSVRNLLDQRFNYLDTDSVNGDIPKTPRYVPDRTFFGQVSLSF